MTLLAEGVAGAGASGRREVAVAFLDGAELRGTIEGFDPRQPAFRLHPGPSGEGTTSREIAFRDVKRVSFLRDPALPKGKATFSLTAKLVTVRFLDRETIHGVTQNHAWPPGGLFLVLTALDEVERLYAPLSAIRDVISVERLGEILAAQGAVTPGTVERALERQGQGLEARQAPLGQILVAMGAATSRTIAVALAIQYNVPFVDVGDQAIDPALRALVPAELARRRRIMPLTLRDDVLAIAVADPAEQAARDELRERTGLTVLPAVATPPDLARAIARYYGS